MRITVFVGLLLIPLLLLGAGFEKEGKTGPLSVSLTSDKQLVIGENSLNIMLKKQSHMLEGATVDVKVFMPEMPGMPYMEYKSSARYVKDGTYYTKLNFSMGGTWQLRIYITTKDGKKYLYKSSLML